MLEDTYFRRTVVVEVDAAVVGISRTRWDSAGANWTEKDALSFIQKKQYDVLPIMDGKHVCSYFANTTWSDDSAIEKRLIRHSDTVHFKMPIRDVIKTFCVDRRNFVFLSSETEIVGLVSVVNLNCRQVKTYLYTLLGELEVQLAELLREYVREEALKAYVFRDSLDPKRKVIKKRYGKDVANGVDAPFLEYVYLTDLIDGVTHFNLDERLGYPEGDFKTKLGKVSKLRNRVAHPTKSLLSGESSPVLLWTCVAIVEEGLFQIKHLHKENVKNPLGVSLD